MPTSSVTFFNEAIDVAHWEVLTGLNQRARVGARQIETTLTCV